MSVSSATTAAFRFPGEDDGRSLAEMAQRDLDAALQLLADRAQYITGSSGAAIALRRSGKNDMLCRATSGSNAPDLGSLLSTEFGLSGESVRTRQVLRCDDAERDARVNREACRELGIASVVVMPVVNDDEVLGVFELFSGKPNAFGERDFAALKRLSEMVETAVRLARAAEEVPQRLNAKAAAAGNLATAKIVDKRLPSTPPKVESPEKAEPAAAPIAKAKPAPQSASVPAQPSAAPPPVQDTKPHAARSAVPAPKSQPAAKPASPTKPLLWSLALEARGDSSSAETDQSHVPAMLRNLRKCEACGFPVSAGRVLCVECEEKKWRGQLKVARRDERPDSTAAAKQLSPAPVPSFTVGATSTSSAATAAAPAPVPEPPPASAPEPGEISLANGQEKKSSVTVTSTSSLPESSAETSLQASASAYTAPAPELVLSAGLEPSQSWFAANKFIIISLLVIGTAVAAVLLVR